MRRLASSTGEQLVAFVGSWLVQAAELWSVENRHAPFGPARLVRPSVWSSGKAQPLGSQLGFGEFGARLAKREFGETACMPNKSFSLRFELSGANHAHVGLYGATYDRLKQYGLKQSLGSARQGRPDPARGRTAYPFGHRYRSPGGITTPVARLVQGTQGAKHRVDETRCRGF